MPQKSYRARFQDEVRSCKPPGLETVSRTKDRRDREGYELNVQKSVRLNLQSTLFNCATRPIIRRGCHGYDGFTGPCYYENENGFSRQPFARRLGVIANKGALLATIPIEYTHPHFVGGPSDGRHLRIRPVATGKHFIAISRGVKKINSMSASDAVPCRPGINLNAGSGQDICGASNGFPIVQPKGKVV